MLSLVLLAVAHSPDAFDPGPNPLLMRHPTMNETTIVFQFADDLWSVPRKGGRASRLTTVSGIESEPCFSPDGKWIAFSGDYDGNRDVYVMPAEGGVPKRLTAHPMPDTVVGWTPDGKSVIFSSPMLSNSDYTRLFTVPITGGFPKALPFPAASDGSLSADGKRLAYVPNIKWEPEWKRYRGGQMFKVWIGELSNSKVQAIPEKGSDDKNPMWVGDKIYFLSDRRGPVGLYSYDVSSGHENEEVQGDGFDIKSATAGPGGIVYEKLGSIHIYNPGSREDHAVKVEIEGDFPLYRPQFKDLQRYLSSTSISPSGSRVALTARGLVFTAPASKGDVRLIDDTQGIHRRDVAWSPDGKSLAYITNPDSMDQLAIYDLKTSKETLYQLGDPPAAYGGPTWSPDSKKIAYTDYRKNLWLFDVATGKSTKVDSSIYLNPTTNNMSPSWSPDSKYITWARDLESHFQAIFVYSLDSGKTSQVTDGMAWADSPVFDKGGKYLYFFASTNVGQGVSWLDISSYNLSNATSSLYAVVLQKDTPNPLQPESDEETPKETPKEAPKEPAKEAKEPAKDAPKEQEKPKAPEPPKAPEAKPIDFDGIESRIIALPAPQMVLNGLTAGPAGSVFVLARPVKASAIDNDGPGSIGKFSFADRKFTPFADGVTGFDTTPDGSKALIQRGLRLQIVPTTAPPAPGQGSVDLSGLQAKIDPIAEWSHMYHETWSNVRVRFYDPKLHGIDSVVMEKRYEPFVKNVRSREDFNYVMSDMLGELSVGHQWVQGGDLGDSRHVPGGLLGADYSFDKGRYRFERIYDGERWNPGLYAPLAQPGVNAKVGEYLLAIDGKDLTDSTDVYEALEGKAGKQVRIKIGPTADGIGSREVVVKAVGQEFTLRQRAWAEDNRRYVLKATNGRAAYVHVPDTNIGGWTEFNRYYYAQTDKDGVVVDERFNHGGLINDFMVHEMKKTLDGAFSPRYNKAWRTPGNSILGPKVMLANEMAGSGGDMFPWLFKHNKIGKIFGKRTWGGLVAAFGFELADGGTVRAPDCAFFDVQAGKWDVEGYGVDPDVVVDLDPAKWRLGIDSQLERAVEELNKQLANYKAPAYNRPPSPDRTKLGVRY